MHHSSSPPLEPGQVHYWAERYRTQATGWDVGYPTPPLSEYIDQLTNQDLQILIPGAGNAYEAEYLWKKGFKNVSTLDLVAEPLAALKQRLPDFPANQLIQGNFFDHEAKYDLLIEQTFFCSFYPSKNKPPSLRPPRLPLFAAWW